VVATAALAEKLPESVPLPVRAWSTGLTSTPETAAFNVQAGTFRARATVAPPCTLPPDRPKDTGLTVTMPSAVATATSRLVKTRPRAVSRPTLRCPRSRAVEVAREPCCETIGLSLAAPFCGVAFVAGRYLSTLMASAVRSKVMAGCLKSVTEAEKARFWPSRRRLVALRPRADGEKTASPLVSSEDRAPSGRPGRWMPSEASRALGLKALVANCQTKRGSLPGLPRSPSMRPVAVSPSPVSRMSEKMSLPAGPSA